MDIRKLQRVIVNALEDVKAQDIKIFNTSKQTALFERVIVATANSNRQTRALGHHVFMEVKENGGDAVGSKVWRPANGFWSTAEAPSFISCSRLFVLITTLRNSGAAIPSV